MILYSGLVVLGYLTGSIASAMVVCRLMGLGDPRAQGSGNPGTTNVLRLYGKTAAAFTLFGDVAKGLAPVVLARLLDSPPWVIALTGAAAFAGHLFPVFFRFRGGKGVATLIGVLLGAHWLLGLAFIATWLATAVLFRYSSVAGLIAAAFTPLYTWLLLPDLSYLVCFSALAAALLLRHQSNIRNLIAGTEKRISVK